MASKGKIEISEILLTSRQFQQSLPTNPNPGVCLIQQIPYENVGADQLNGKQENFRIHRDFWSKFLDTWVNGILKNLQI